jgi:hypothetical protein
MTRTDMANLLALVVDPDADDALLVPQLGRRGNDLTLPQPPLRLPGGSGQQLPRAVDAVMGPGLRTPVGGSGAFTASLDTREDDDDDDDASEVGVILCSGGCDVQCQCRANASAHSHVCVCMHQGGAVRLWVSARSSRRGAL